MSTCDGPPFMNRKITRFARAGKWGGRGARGLRRTASSVAVRAGCRRPVSATTEIPASDSTCASPAHRIRRRSAKKSHGESKAGAGAIDSSIRSRSACKIIARLASPDHFRIEVRSLGQADECLADIAVQSTNKNSFAASRAWA